MFRTSTRTSVPLRKKKNLDEASSGAAVIYFFISMKKSFNSKGLQLKVVDVLHHGHVFGWPLRRFYYIRTEETTTSRSWLSCQSCCFTCTDHIQLHRLCFFFVKPSHGSCLKCHWTVTHSKRVDYYCCFLTWKTHVSLITTSSWLLFIQYLENFWLEKTWEDETDCFSSGALWWLTYFFFFLRAQFKQYRSFEVGFWSDVMNS